MTKLTLPQSLITPKNLAVKFTKKYGVAIAATTAAIVVFTKLKEEETDEDIVVIDQNAN